MALGLITGSACAAHSKDVYSGGVLPPDGHFEWPQRVQVVMNCFEDFVCPGFPVEVRLDPLVHRRYPLIGVDKSYLDTTREPLTD